jgi:hypothetical protein
MRNRVSLIWLTDAMFGLSKNSKDSKMRKKKDNKNFLIKLDALSNHNYRNRPGEGTIYFHSRKKISNSTSPLIIRRKDSIGICKGWIKPRK